ncbi:MAG: DUF2202 domain-containing protein [Gammaproteobacteria bacterium]|nr:DUF2202 domain-containing protein [Gammaproteobacteria bacterium]MBQ0840475.1 DUF2202 domain-containing protein [Gammaproteobacteria bacterium]
MTTELKAILTEAIDDEYKARAIYRLVLQHFGDIAPFANIVEAEGRHIEALVTLFKKYAIPVPEDEWAAKAETPDSIIEACKTGVSAEIENAAMYDKLLKAAVQYPDVQAVLTNLQQASQENHLPAFQRCLDRGGTPEGGRGMGRRRRQGRGNK